MTKKAPATPTDSQPANVQRLPREPDPWEPNSDPKGVEVERWEPVIGEPGDERGTHQRPAMEPRGRGGWISHDDHISRLEEVEKYAAEGWAWLDEALDALGAKDVFGIADAKQHLAELRARADVAEARYTALLAAFDGKASIEAAARALYLLFGDEGWTPDAGQRRMAKKAVQAAKAAAIATVEEGTE